MHSKSLPTLLALLQVSYVFAGLTGNCPNLPVVKNFNVKDFGGTWYQQASFGTLLFQGVGTCAKAVYTLDEKTKTVDVDNSQKNVFGGKQEVKGSAVLADTSSKEGKLKVTLNTAVGKQTADLWVLATDYHNFAILYSCKDIINPFKSGWILTRKQQLKDADKEAVDKLIDAAFTEITKTKGAPKRSDFSKTSQEGC